MKVIRRPKLMMGARYGAIWPPSQTAIPGPRFDWGRVSLRLTFAIAPRLSLESEARGLVMPKRSGLNLAAIYEILIVAIYSSATNKPNADVSGQGRGPRANLRRATVRRLANSWTMEGQGPRPFPSPHPSGSDHLVGFTFASQRAFRAKRGR
jgi:hypothetical protein